MTTMNSTETVGRLLVAQKSIEAARAYTLTMLDGLSDDQWFWTPDGFNTHIAWQIGHIAYAQYGLVLFRQRGRLSEDANLMSNKFRKLFAKGSLAVSADESFSIDSIREVFENVYEQAIKELPTFNEQELDEPLDPPFAGFASKFGSLLMAAHHEMLHAGQIGFLRRLMGKEPVR